MCVCGGGGCSLSNTTLRPSYFILMALPYLNPLGSTSVGEGMCCFINVHFNIFKAVKFVHVLRTTFQPCHEKTNNMLSEQVQHKQS